MHVVKELEIGTYRAVEHRWHLGWTRVHHLQKRGGRIVGICIVVAGRGAWLSLR